MSCTYTNRVLVYLVLHTTTCTSTRLAYRYVYPGDGRGSVRFDALCFEIEIDDSRSSTSFANDILLPIRVVHVHVRCRSKQGTVAVASPNALACVACYMLPITCTYARDYGVSFGLSVSIYPGGLRRAVPSIEDSCQYQKPFPPLACLPVHSLCFLCSPPHDHPGLRFLSAAPRA